MIKNLKKNEYITVINGVYEVLLHIYLSLLYSLLLHVHFLYNKK